MSFVSKHYERSLARAVERNDIEGTRHALAHVDDPRTVKIFGKLGTSHHSSGGAHSVHAVAVANGALDIFEVLVAKNASIEGLKNELTLAVEQGVESGKLTVKGASVDDKFLMHVLLHSIGMESTEVVIKPETDSPIFKALEPNLAADLLNKLRSGDLDVHDREILNYLVEESGSASHLKSAFVIALRVDVDEAHVGSRLAYFERAGFVDKTGEVVHAHEVWEFGNDINLLTGRNFSSNVYDITDAGKEALRISHRG